MSQLTADTCGGIRYQTGMTNIITVGDQGQFNNQSATLNMRRIGCRFVSLVNLNRLFMKRITLVLLAALSFLHCYGQEADSLIGRYSVGAQYTQEFVLGGFVQVREWEFAGDKMLLRDLGMRTYPALQVHLTKHLKLDRNLTFMYDHYFIRGDAKFERDIFYNGTLIKGEKGIDVSSTRYYRITVMYSGPLFSREPFRLGYLGGLVFDHIVFYLDGEVSPLSPKNEVYEGFGRQAFPYPILGLQAAYYPTEKSALNVELSGTYIPEFKSFYTEGGNIYLQYSNLQTQISYCTRIGRVALIGGLKLRHMKLFQESKEDTNEIWTLTAGPFIEMSYHF
jgi:hypothetical protein